MNFKPLDEKDIFKIACGLDSAEARRDYLRQVCADNPTLLARVETLLRMQDEDPGFLESPPPGLVGIEFLPQAERLDSRIGPYKLRELIGEGGFGLVYVAEQEQPIRRKVALKVIKPGMDSKEVIARFEAERQALALMDHSNIAKVHDAGTTETGRPYFVMELVRGLPITDYCDQAKLSLRERLELCITVCRAVQHANQKGIIHRDLKPSNVLITLHDGVPVPKVIDFGVAKALNQRLTEHSLYTRHAQMLGTPMYMSPEQAELSGLDVDTRSDVYSLGVLLYEILTGQTPFDKETFSKLGYDELRRMVREVEPPRPSTRVSTLAGDHRSTVANRRGIDERHHSRTLRGELDWIVMKALEKDRTRRYGSADALAADLKRYLDAEPVQACPPSVTYRLRKLAQRKRGLIATIALLAVSIPWAVFGLYVMLSGNDAVPATAASAVTRLSPKAELQSPVNPARAPGRTLPGLVSEPPLIPDVGRWQLMTKKPRGAIRSAVWSPDETLLALGEANNVRIYDTTNLQLLHVLVGHNQPVRSVAWHSDGKRLASCSEDGTVRLWTATGKPTHLLDDHTGPVYQVAWCPDGTQLVSCGADGTVRLWSDEGQLIQTLDEGGRHVFGIDWSPDGTLLATVGGDVHPAGPDGDAGDNSVRIWNPHTRELVNKIPTSMKYSGLCVDWRPDGTQFAVGFGHIHNLTSWRNHELPDAGVRLWNSNGTPGPEVGRDKGSISAVSWRSDGKQIAFGGRIGYVWFWDADSQQVTDSGIQQQINLGSLAWSRDDSRLLVTHRGQICEWNGGRTEPLVAAISHKIEIRDIRWSPDGSILCGLLKNAASTFWTSQGTRRGMPELHSTHVPPWWEQPTPLQRPDGVPAPAFENLPDDIFTRFAWSADGWLASAKWSDQTVRIWNHEGQQIAALHGHRGTVQSVAWSPDGTQIVCGGGDSVWILNRDGTPGPVMTGHADEVHGVAWSPDGQWIASCSSDSSVRLWKPNGDAGPVLLGHQGGAGFAVVFSPDSKKLASASWLDGTVRVWDIATGRTEWQAIRIEADRTITVSAAGVIIDGEAEIIDTSLVYALERRDGTVELINPPEFRRRISAQIIQQYADLFAQLTELHDFDGSEAVLNQAMMLIPALNAKSRAALVNMAGQFSEALWFDRDYGRAEQMLRKAIELQEQIAAELPDDRSHLGALSSLWLDLGRFLSGVGRNTDALAALTKAIDLKQQQTRSEPDDKLGPKSLAFLLYERAQRQPTLQDALVDLDRVIETDPSIDRIAWDLIYFLDDLLSEPGGAAPAPEREIAADQQIEVAKGLFLEAIKRLPNLPNQQMFADWLCSAPERFRDPELALELAQRAAEVGATTSDMQPTESIAWAQFRLGDLQACLATLRKPTGDQDTRDASEFIRAMAHQRLGDPNAARIAFERGVEWSKDYIQTIYVGRWKNGKIWNPTPGMVRRLEAEAAAMLGEDDKQAQAAARPQINESHP